ncbi:MAG: RNA-binding transcriptional accessory protein [Bacilli bacterium]|nr:RNA-binding transcriptional accessory protein [Bacilli bacterium]
MNKEIIKEIAQELNIKIEQVKAVLTLLEEGNTIPFIARYRKEKTGSLDEEQIRKINEVYDYQVSLLKRKEDVIRLIDEKGLLTEELKNNILNCNKLVEVEDLYRPYKEKKKTKATDAINNGLEPLAKTIMSFPNNLDIEKTTSNYLNDKVKSIKEAIQGAKYIIAEWISDNASYRKWIRNNMYYKGKIVSKLKKNAKDETKTYEMYYDYNEPVKYIKPHRILAINRGEKENVLNVNIEIDNKEIETFLKTKIIKNTKSNVSDIVIDAINDSLKRLILPSVEREVRADLTEIGENSAIDNFGKNLEKLLLTPPMKDKIVLGFDPAFRTGCKLAVIDQTRKKLEIAVIYPHEPHNKYEESKKILTDLIKKYKVEIIAIGNGTASRESEKFVSQVIKEEKLPTEYIIVSEAGASVYSASKLAIEEFPDLTVEKRSAISIGRRLQDPLSELVKITPESIGVGQYQHDVSSKKLTESLDFVVSKAVNSVGVNINTASPSLLKYVSGITKKNIDKIIEYRNKEGKINSREEIKKKKLLSDKTYEQAIGFLRIIDGDNILDVTSVHPESYNIALNLLKELNCTTKDIGTNKLIDLLDNIDINTYKDKLNTDIYTLEDIISSLKKPNRDPRDDMPKPILKSDVLDINDLQIGMKLQGTVRNVIDFGAFVDIGLHNDGLIHISKMTNNYIKHPSEILNVGDIIDCYVIDINKEKEKVSLSLIEPNLLKN